MVRASGLREAIFAAAATAVITGTLTLTAAVNANEFFQPYGATDHFGVDREPPLNSAQDRFNEQADIYQSEINRSQRERAYWDTYMRNNLLNHDHFQDVPYARDY